MSNICIENITYLYLYYFIYYINKLYKSYETIVCTCLFRDQQKPKKKLKN